MRYGVGDKFLGKCEDGASLIGLIEKYSPEENKYFVRWMYDDREPDRHSWYTEAWLGEFEIDNHMKHVPLDLVNFDEKLFII